MRWMTAVFALGLAACAGSTSELITAGAPLDRWCPAGLGLTADNGSPEGGSTSRFLYVGCELDPGIAHGPAMVWRTDTRQIMALMFMERGRLHGPALHWCENGELWQQHSYRQGLPAGPSYLWDCDTRAERVFDQATEQ